MRSSPARRSILLFGFVTGALASGCADSEAQDAGPGDADISDVDPGPCSPTNLRVDIESDEGLLYTSARFSPDGTEVALLAWRGLALDDILIVGRCGENVRRLEIRASAKAVSTWSPSWSPDGSQIYFVGSEDSVRRVSAQGGVSEIVVSSVQAPVLDLSRDGKKVLYGGAQDFRIVDLETRTSTSLGVYGTSPRFSPDAQSLAFTRDRRVELIDLSTREVRTVASFDSPVRLSVAWFSGGDRLAITSERGVEVVEITDPESRRSIGDDPLSRDVDVSPDDDAVLFGLNGKAPIRVIRGFD